jgi:hypothetical protein
VAKAEDIAFVVPVKDGMWQTLYLKSGVIVVIDVRSGTVEHVSRLPSSDDIATVERAAEGSRALRGDLEHRLPRLPIREIDHTDRRAPVQGDSHPLPTGVDRRT